MGQHEVLNNLRPSQQIALLNLKCIRKCRENPSLLVKVGEFWLCRDICALNQEAMEVELVLYVVTSQNEQLKLAKSLPFTVDTTPSVFPAVLDLRYNFGAFNSGDA